MAGYLSPISAVTGVLRGCGTAVPGITWGSAASPYYRQVPEPPPDPISTPYVEFDVKNDGGDDVMGGDAHSDFFTVTFRVYAGESVVEQISSPWAPQGLFHWLDTLSFQVFSGAMFECQEWQGNHDWGIDLDDRRAPDTQRVWVATQSYRMSINKLT